MAKKQEWCEHCKVMTLQNDMCVICLRPMKRRSRFKAWLYGMLIGLAIVAWLAYYGVV